MQLSAVGTTLCKGQRDGGVVMRLQLGKAMRDVAKRELGQVLTEYPPPPQCAQCKQTMRAEEFSKTQLDLGDAKRCRECAKEWLESDGRKNPNQSWKTLPAGSNPM
jgi:hypothetical protein